MHYIKNPHILADKIVEIYNTNPSASFYNPKNKNNPVKLQNVVNKIDKDVNIVKQYKEFVENLEAFRVIQKFYMIIKLIKI